ncbi:uncharacterized protein LOC135075443 [Ostrinia nubilalis]|uniref:uncharacterized protein LOC135075443 n=1 Tax=Ostrinia nubilalis TaxID=29057 RepID=UPI003082232E
MLSPAVLFNAITIIFHILQVYCNPAPVQELDFRSFIELVQNHNAQKDRQDEYDKYEVDSREESNSHYGSLKSQEIVELVHRATQGKEWNNKIYDDKDSDERKKESSKGQYYKELYKELEENSLNDGLLYNYQSNVKNKDKYKDDDDRYQYSRYNEEALEQLLTQNVLDRKYKDKPRHKLVPNSLAGSEESKNYRDENRDNLGAYSKVYVVLNPKATEKSPNKEKLNKLLAKILSLTSSSSTVEKKNRKKKYKGFSVKPGFLSRRARRDSREMFGKDSVEEDFRPKRSRNDRGSGGGGGGAGGRTAIPYIRHRGDIYERDN